MVCRQREVCFVCSSKEGGHLSVATALNRRTINLLESYERIYLSSCTLKGKYTNISIAKVYAPILKEAGSLKRTNFVKS